MLIEPSVGSVLDSAFGDASSQLLAHVEQHPGDHIALEIERPNLLWAIDWSYESERWREVMRFVDIVGPPARGFLGLGGYWEDVVRCCQQAISSAKALNDLAKLARYTSNLGIAYQRLGKSGQAVTAYEAALQLLIELKDEEAAAVVLHQMGNHARSRRALAEAQAVYERSLAISRKYGRTGQVAATLYQMGAVAYDKQDEDLAEQYYRESLQLVQQLGDARLECRILNGLANIATVRQEFDTGRDYLVRSLDLAYQLGDVLQIAHAIMDQAFLEEWAEEYQKSFELSEEALPLLIQLQSPLAERLSRLRQRVLEKLSRQ